MVTRKKSRIVIRDIPRNQRVSREEMRMVMGGIETIPLPEVWRPYPRIGTWPTPEISGHSYFARREKGEIL